MPLLQRLQAAGAALEDDRLDGRRRGPVDGVADGLFVVVESHPASLDFTGDRRAAPPGPRVGDRRRPGDAHGPYGAAPGHLRRLHRLGPRAGLHRGLHPRRGAAPLRQHPHRVQRHRAADHAAARGRPPRSSTRPSAATTTTVGDLLRLGRDRRDRQADRRPRPADPRRPGRPLPARPTHIPADAAAGGLHRALRAPLQRAARGASRSPTWSSIPQDADGHIDLDAPRAASCAATPTGR